MFMQEWVIWKYDSNGNKIYLTKWAPLQFNSNVNDPSVKSWYSQAGGQADLDAYKNDGNNIDGLHLGPKPS